MNKLAQSALKQIWEKQYAAEMRAEGVKEIISAGFAFCGKKVATFSDFSGK